jgi:GNAT superfamily N-acetyltransferase
VVARDERSIGSDDGIGHPVPGRLCAGRARRPGAAAAGRPVGPEATGAPVRDWIVCALVAAAARFVPVPLLDDAVADRATVEAVRRTLRVHGRTYPVDRVSPLYQGQGWASRLLRSVARLPLRLALYPFRKIVRVVGAVRGVPADVTRVLALAHTTDRVLARGGLSSDDPQALRQEARVVRAAFDAVLREMDLRLLRGVLGDALTGVRGLSEAVIAHGRDRFDRDRRAGSLEAPGPMVETVARVQEALRRPEVRRQVAEFDARLDARLGVRPGAGPGSG